MNTYQQFFGLVKQLEQMGVVIDRREIILEFTGGKKESLKDLSADEYRMLCARLTRMIPNYYNDKLDRARKAIISQFLSIGKTAQDAIKWAEKYGVNGRKKRFNDYDGQELYKLLMNAKKMKVETIKKVTRGLQPGE